LHDTAGRPDGKRSGGEGGGAGRDGGGAAGGVGVELVEENDGVLRVADSGEGYLVGGEVFVGSEAVIGPVA
jgi:hypothetical protein